MYGEAEGESEHSGNALGWLIQIIQIVAAAVFTWEGVAKLAGQDDMVEMFGKLGFGDWPRYVVGGAEIVCALMLLLPPSARAGAVLLALLMLGAVVSDLSMLHVSPALPFTMLLLMAFVAVFKRKRRVHHAKHSFAPR